MFRPPNRTLAPDAATGRRIERRETPAEKVTPNSLVPSAGYVIDAEFDIEAPPGKPDNHPDCRAGAQGDLASQQQTIRAAIQQPDGHRHVKGHDRPAFGGDARRAAASPELVLHLRLPREPAWPTVG